MKFNLKKLGIAFSVMALALMLFSFTSHKSGDQKLGVANSIAASVSEDPLSEEPEAGTWARAAWYALKAASRELDHMLLMASTYSVVDEATVLRSNRIKTILMSKL